MDNYIVRGILIGGSVGVFAGMIGVFGLDMGRAAAVGMVAGFLAGLTRARRESKRQGPKGKQ